MSPKAVPAELQALSDYATVQLMKKAVFAADVVIGSVTDYLSLGFDPSYFKMYSHDKITAHIYGYLCAKVSPTVEFGYSLEEPDYAFYFSPNTVAGQAIAESRIEATYFTEAREVTKHGLSLRTYASADAAAVGPLSVVLFVLEVCAFPALPEGADPAAIASLGTERFMTSRDAVSIARYAESLRLLRDTFHPGVFQILALEQGVSCLQMAFMPDRASYFVALCSLIQRMPGVTIVKKFLETFRSGAQVYSFYMRGADAEGLKQAAVLASNMGNRKLQASITDMFLSRAITPSESVYATSIIFFAFYFTPPASTDHYSELKRAVRHDQASTRNLRKIRDEMHRELMSEAYITDVLVKHTGLFHKLYTDFESGPTAASRLELEALINKEVRNLSERDVYLCFLTFNTAVKKTNFFKAEKAAIAYRLDPAFIAKLDYPRVPYAIFFVVGAQFRGFHIRFADIARGGIRIIKSHGVTQLTRETQYRKNKAFLFMENYNLAFTQMLKNKDIPESGSKGTILVSVRNDVPDRVLYLQYIDALLDVMLPPTGGVRSTMGDGTEFLFMGPDEGTAGAFPSLAANHAKKRGYPLWKSFATGKLPDIGGIPHDIYGMTTMSVRQYSLGIYRKLNLTETALTKFVTGGPDGDLGSNEIKQGKEKVVAMCDGFASVHDPVGIDRAELLRLAEGRLSLGHFDKAKLSKKGFHVGVNEKNVTLPDGLVVANGTAFRNSFHFSAYADADIFVPCGGRPASVALENVTGMLRNAAGVSSEQMLSEQHGVTADKLRFKYIVEGANLFVTQDARLALENVGVILFKDASTNKGGVTSSSLEVLAGLALTDAQHKEHMCVTGAAPPAFYQALVTETCDRLRHNALREFECLWRDVELGFLKGKRTLISDALSEKINEIKTFIQGSSLHSDQVLFRYIVKTYVPATILGLVSLDDVMARVPASYLVAILAIYIASDFVYSTGLSANEFSFFQYMHKLHKLAEADQGAPSKL
jgi:glutamate dehydrogenase